MNIQPQYKACGIENASQESNSSAICILPWLMVGCGIILMLIWPAIHTIALRNILLSTGGFIGLWYLIYERSDLYQKSALPLLFILLFLVWLVIHYFLFAHNPELESEQIISTWLRVMFACFLGVGTGLFARRHRRAQHAIGAGIFLSVIFFYIDYAWVSFTINNWAIPYPVELGFYALKNAVLFFGIISLAICCGVISYNLIHIQKNNRLILFASMFYMGLTFLTFVFVGTKSGVALSLILMFNLFVIYLVKVNKSYINITIASIFIGIICLLSYWHLKITPQWDNFLPTVTAGIQIDKYPNWQDTRTYGLPKLADGSEARESPYVRTASATEGLKLLLENPWGYGLVDESFKYLTKENLPNAHSLSLSASQSGWLDFSLGLGMPGLLLTWAAIASAIFYSFKQNSLWSYCSRWILAGTFLVWMVADVSSHHFVETLFYLIVLLSAGNLPIILISPQSIY